MVSLSSSELRMARKFIVGNYLLSDQEESKKKPHERRIGKE